MKNKIRIENKYVGRELSFVAQPFEYNLDDTVLLADALLDRDGEFSLTYSPKGSGILGLSITSRFGPPPTSGSITLGGFVTVITGYEAQQFTMTICNEGDDKYRFGFNGQEKVNEIAGTGNHNTALFWEYDTRLGRRWNIDPVDQISIRNYTTFGNNPISNSDLLGNKWKDEVNDQKVADREGKVVGGRKAQLENELTKLEDKRADAVTKGDNDKIDKLDKKIEQKQHLIGSLQEVLDGLVAMKNDSKVTYTFEEHAGIDDIKLDPANPNSNIQKSRHTVSRTRQTTISGTPEAPLVTMPYTKPFDDLTHHEIGHGVQIALGFCAIGPMKNGNAGMRATLLLEQKCYFIQFAMNPAGMPSAISTYETITNENIKTVDPMYKNLPDK